MIRRDLGSGICDIRGFSRRDVLSQLALPTNEQDPRKGRDESVAR